MTNIKKVAQQVNDAYENSYTESGLVAALREVINQLQQSSASHPAFISCPDLLDLCEELKAL